MQKKIPSCVTLLIAALAFLFPCGSAPGVEGGSRGSERIPPSHPDEVMSTGPSGIYHYYDKERDEWVSGVATPPPGLQENQSEFPLIIAPEIKLPMPGGRPPLRPEPRLDPGRSGR